VKPQEVAHDVALCRMYQAEAAEIEKGDGTIRRDGLDFELKKSVYAPLVKVKLMGPGFRPRPSEYRYLATETENLSSLWAHLG
jgi:hypothetical protein